MKTIKTIKKALSFAFALSFALNLNAEGYYGYFKAWVMPRYETFMNSAQTALSTGTTAVKAADSQVTEYAINKNP